MGDVVKTKLNGPGWGPFSLLGFGSFGWLGALAGVVAENQLGHARIDGSDLYAAVQPSDSKVSVALNLLPIGLKLVFVSKFVE